MFGGVIWSKILLVVLKSGIISINIVIDINFKYRILVFLILKNLKIGGEKWKM